MGSHVISRCLTCLRACVCRGTCTEIPAGVRVDEAGTLRDKQGRRLPRGLHLAAGGRGFALGPNSTPLPKGLSVVARHCKHMCDFHQLCP